MPQYLDDTYLTYAIMQAQDIELQNVLGTPLYTDVYHYEKAYLSSGTTMPAEYTDLINKYIKPFLVNYTIYRALDSIWAKTLNTSVIVKTDAANSRPVTRDELTIDKKRFLSLASWNRDMLRRYITTQNNNFGYFSSISSFTADPDTILPDRGPGYGRAGIYFKRKNNGRNYYGAGDSVNFGTSSSSSEERGSADNQCCN